MTVVDPLDDLDAVVVVAGLGGGVHGQAVGLKAGAGGAGPHLPPGRPGQGREQGHRADEGWARGLGGGDDDAGLVPGLR